MECPVSISIDLTPVLELYINAQFIYPGGVGPFNKTCINQVARPAAPSVSLQIGLSSVCQIKGGFQKCMGVPSEIIFVGKSQHIGNYRGYGKNHEN